MRISDVQAKLTSLRNDELSIGEFDRWVMANSWNMHLDSSGEAQKIVRQVQLRFAEYDNGDLSAEELRNDLLALIEKDHVVKVYMFLSAQQAIQEPVRTSVTWNPHAIMRARVPLLT